MFKYFMMFLKILPCIKTVVEDYNAAKKDDGKIDIEEGVGLGTKFALCLLGGLGLAAEDAKNIKAVLTAIKF